MKWIFLLVGLIILGWGVKKYIDASKQQQLLAELMAHQSRVEWKIDQNPTERKIEEATRLKIETDYTNAWKQQSICWFTNDSTGLYAYFVPYIRTEIIKNAADFKKKHVSIIQKDLRHRLQLCFYSLDGQVVTMTDSATVFKQIDGVKQTQSHRYDLILLLEEGHWRIKNQVWK